MRNNIQKIRRILVTTGLTEESVGAILMARQLAEELNAALHAVHVIAPVSGAHERAVPGLMEQVERTGREALEAFAKEQGLREFAELHVAVGNPEQEILSLGIHLEADLIVIGRWGKGGPKQGMLGSIAQRVVRRYPLSVLIVEPTYRGSIARIAVASACIDSQNLELERGLELATTLGHDRISMIMAYEVPCGYHLVSDYDEAEAKLREVHEGIARRQIESARANTGATVAVDVVVEVGRPAAVLSAFVEREGVELLVLGAHTRSRPAEIFLDHAAERIINQTNCSIWAEKNPMESHRLRDLIFGIFN